MAGWRVEPRCGGRWLSQAAVLAAALGVVAGSAAAQARKPAQETLKGKLVKVEPVGKTKNVSVTFTKDDGTEVTLTATPRVPVLVAGSGDSGFLRAGVYVSSSLYTSGDRLYGKEFTVHLVNSMPAKVKQDAAAREVYHVVGKIEAADENTITVNFASQGGSRKIVLEEGFTVKVESPDAELAGEGAAVEAEVIPLASGKFNVKSILLKPAAELSSETVFAKIDEKKGTSAAPGKSKSAAPKSAPPNAPGA